MIESTTNKEVIITLGNEASAVVTDNTLTVTGNQDGAIVRHRFVWEDGKLKAIEFESKK
jgi:hypothetical protein